MLKDRLNRSENINKKVIIDFILDEQQAVYTIRDEGKERRQGRGREKREEVVFVSSGVISDSFKEASIRRCFFL